MALYGLLMLLKQIMYIIQWCAALTIWTELLILGAVIALRGVLTLLLHWEIKVEEEHDERLLKLKAMEEAEKTAETSKQ